MITTNGNNYSVIIILNFRTVLLIKFWYIYFVGNTMDLNFNSHRFGRALFLLILYGNKWIINNTHTSLIDVNIWSFSIVAIIYRGEWTHAHRNPV